MMLLPFATLCPAHEQEEAAPTAQEAWVKVPESVPLVQTLVWETHWLPEGTDADW